MLRSVLCFALICGSALFANPPAHAASAMAELIAAAQAAEKFDPARVAAVYRETVLKGEGIPRTVARLEALARQSNLNNSAQAHLYLAIAHLQWRDGEIGQAVSSSARALELAPNGDTLLFQARVLDAIGDSQQAKDLYRRAAETIKESGQRWAIRTRLAMMDTSRINIETLENLALRRDQQFRNQAAVVLALLGRPERAIALYEPRADDGSLYPQHVRLAEWALKAGEHGLAREQAWMAYSEAEVRLDRRYALALLSESHRATEDLDRLLGDLAIRGVGDEEILRLRVETLIETEEYAQAIELYRQLEGSEADIRQRSRLVSLYEAAGDTEGMVSEYERMMQSEPDQVQWYEGLAAHYLHRARPGRALRVWRTLEERNSERAEVLVAAAGLMLQLGFTAESMAMIERHIQAHGPNVGSLFFLFEAHLDMAKDTEALEVLARLDEFLPPNAAERRDLADAYERVSRPREAVRVFEEIRDSGGGLGYDEQMRLARLYGTVDRNQDALRQWQEIWIGVESPARRFFVEEQMMLLAAETGALGDMALELEAMLSEGTANRHHMSLLVRIYTEAGDKLSATEIIGDYARELGEDEIGHQVLLAQVYRQLEDYSAYDQALRRLYEIDPENREDHIRGILINLLTFDLVTGSNQRFDEINRWIGELRRLDPGAATAEFVGNIYSRAGFVERALESYLRALVSEPENSDILLLMADVLKTQGRADEAVAVLQYFAEHAINDNEFVVAVDGIINMLGTSSFFEQPDPEKMEALDWTRRIILERIAANASKSYFFELLADIAREKRETESSFRALENSLAHAGIRRAALLRELLTMSTPSTGFGGFNTGSGDMRRQLQFGRRLVGLRLQWPPEVYVDIGKSLLNTGDLSGAERAFEMIDDITGLMDVDRTKAEILEEQGYEQESLQHYNRALSVNRDSLDLLHKTGLLSEAKGESDVAFRRYLDATKGLLRRQAAELADEPPAYQDPLQALFGPHEDTTVPQEFREHYPSLEQGLLLNWPKDTEQSAQAVGELTVLFDDELRSVLERSGKNLLTLSRYVRLDRIARLIRRVGYYLNDSGIADHVDLRLLEHFGDDPEFARFLRKRYGDAGRRFPMLADLTIAADDAGHVEGAPESLLRRQLALAAEREDFRAQLELLVLEGASGEIKALLLERILAGHYREGLGYARARLSEQEYSDLVLSVSPKLFEDRAALLRLVGLDAEMYMHTENVAGHSLVPDGKVLEILMSPQAWELVGDAYAETIGFWEYLEARSSIDDRIRYLRALVERSGGDQVFSRMDPGGFLRDLLREELSRRQRQEIAELLIEYLSKQDSNYEESKYELMAFVSVADAHVGNLPVLYRALDYIARRWPAMPKFRPLLEALYEERFDEAFRQYANLTDQDFIMRGFFSRNKDLSEGLAHVGSRLLDALGSRQPVDTKLARAAFDTEFPIRREATLTDEELKRKADVLHLLSNIDPDQDFYRQELIHVWLRLGEIQRAREGIAHEYRIAPENEDWRLAFFLILIMEHRFSEALALAGDGGSDYSHVQTLQQALRSQFMNFSFAASRKVIEHLQTSSGWAPAAMQNLGLPGFEAPEREAEERLRKAMSDADHGNGQLALRESWRKLLAPNSAPYGPRPDARQLPLFADSLLSAPLEDPAESSDADSVWNSHRFVPLVVIPHMPAGRAMTHRQMRDSAQQTPRTLFEAVTKSPYGASELGAYLRAMPDEQRQSFFRLYEYLARAHLASGDRDLFDDLSSRLAAGNIDDHSFTLWMLLHDLMEMEFAVGNQDAFERRLNEMNDPTSYQLLLAARLLAAGGRLEEAVEHYKTVAARRIQHGEYSMPVTRVIVSVTNTDSFGDLSMLMEEVAERLPAESAREVIDAALELSRRADYPQETKSLLDAFALNSLGSVYSPRELPAEAQSWSPTVLERPESLLDTGGPKAVELVRIYARSGELRLAAELLGEILKRPSDNLLRPIQWESTRREVESSTAANALSVLFGMEIFDNDYTPDPQNAGLRELMSRQERFLPSNTEDWPNARDWIAVLTKKLRGWLEGGDLDPGHVIPLYVAAAMSPVGGGATAGNVQQPGELYEDLLAAIDASGQPISVADLTTLAPLATAAGSSIPLDWTADLIKRSFLSWQEQLDLLRIYAGTEYEVEVLALFREAGLDFGLEVPRQLLAMAEAVGDESYARELRERVTVEEAAKRALQPAEQE